MFANLSKKLWLFLFLTPICSHISLAKKAKKEISKKRQARIDYHKRRTIPQPHRDTSWKNLTEEQFVDILEYAREVSNKELELKTLLQLSKTAKKSSNLKEYLLQLADFYFELKKMEKAVEYYDNYYNLYPSSDAAEYAFYKKMMAAFFQTLEPNRDTTPTEQTVEYATQFLDFAMNEEFRQEARDILKRCAYTLCMHEVYVFDHYIKQKKITSAELRLEYIKKHYLHVVPDAKRLMPHLEEVLKAAQDSKSRTFFIGVDFEYGKPQAKKAKTPEQRHVSRIKL